LLSIVVEISCSFPIEIQLADFHWCYAKNQEINSSSPTKLSYILKILSSLDIRIWNLKMARKHWSWDRALLHGPTAPLFPAFHSETYKKRNWQRDGIIQQWWNKN
jgi:hypothetical protein